VSINRALLDRIRDCSYCGCTVILWFYTGYGAAAETALCPVQTVKYRHSPSGLKGKTEDMLLTLTGHVTTGMALKRGQWGLQPDTWETAARFWKGEGSVVWGGGAKGLAAAAAAARSPEPGPAACSGATGGATKWPEPPSEPEVLPRDRLFGATGAGGRPAINHSNHLLLLGIWERPCTLHLGATPHQYGMFHQAP